MTRSLLVFSICMVLVAGCRKENDMLSSGTPPETKPPVLTKYRKSLFLPFTGYYEALPANYHSNSVSYPLLVFLHGLGQKGDGDSQLDLVGYDGLGKSLLENKIPASFTVNGNNYSFIYICPQYAQVPAEEDVKKLIDTLVKKYRVNKSKIYLSGLSVGGVVTTETAARYPTLFKAIVAMGGTTFSGQPGDFAQRCRNIAEASLPVWAFHNEFDPTIPRGHTEEFINKIISYNPPVKPVYTLFPAQYGHNSWTRALDTAYKEKGVNIYQWMLGY